MATQDGEDVQRANKVGLKRKLTGPPRLLLGKTRTRSVGEDRAEAGTSKDKTENRDRDRDESSVRHSATAETDITELTENNVDIETSRGGCEAAGDDDITNRKLNKHRWWRRFSPAVVCNKKQKKDVKGGSVTQSSAPPEGAPQQSDAFLNSTEGNMEKVSKRRRRFNMRTWPMFMRFLNSSNVGQTRRRKDFVEKDDEQTLPTFREKLKTLFTKRGKNRSSAVDNIEDLTQCEEAQVDQATALHSDVRSPEVVTVTAEMSKLTEERAAEGTPTEEEEEELVCDVIVTEEELTDAGGPEMIHTEDVEAPKDTNTTPAEGLVEVSAEGMKVSAEEDEELCQVILHHPTSEVHCEDETTAQSLQPSTNGPSIRIELVPPDDLAQEDEDNEECSFSENQNLLLLLSFEHSEHQLVQTARSLVRAAVNAAVNQLTREQQSASDCVHREPPGCRDHA